MNYSSEVVGDVKIITVNKSRATFNEAEEFKLLLEKELENNFKKVVVSLKGCKYMDSTFLGALVNSLRKYNKEEASIKICDLYSEALILFEITGMLRIFDVYQTKDEAILKFSKVIE